MTVIDQGTLHRDYAAMCDLRAGLMIYIPSDAVGLYWPDTVVVAGFYVGTEEFHIVPDVPSTGLKAWCYDEVPIEDALPGLSVADRLFVQCGSKAFELLG
jgi:hypothetical protein